MVFVSENTHKAALTKFVQEMLPSSDITVSRKTIDLLSDCCVEFIQLLSSEANEICEKEAKKMIAGEHVVAALKSLGFDAYVDEINESYQEHQKQLKVFPLCLLFDSLITFLRRFATD